MNRIPRTLVSVVVTALAAAAAAVPVNMPYSGQLAESDELVNGTRNMTFRICRDTACVYTADFADVAVTNGAFSVLLGGPGTPSLDSSIFAETGLLLRVTVEGTDLTPDVLLPFAPYAAGGDHATLQNLAQDTHTQYLNRDGSRAMTGDLSLGGNGIVNGGSVTITSSTISGNATVGGTLGVTGATTLGGTVTTQGGATIGTNLGVMGSTTVNGTGFFGGGVSAGGSSSLQGLSVSTNVGITGNLTVNGNTVLGNALTDTVTINSTVTTTGDVTVGADFNVVGLSELNSDATIGGSAVVVGDVAAQSNVTVGADLNVVGLSELNSDATVGADLVVNGSTTLGDAAADTITVNGTLVALNTVTVSDLFCTQTDAKVMGDLMVSGMNDINPAMPDGLQGTAVLTAVNTTGMTIPAGNTLYVTGAFVDVDDTLTINNVNAGYMAALRSVSFPSPVVVPGGATLRAGTSSVKISGIQTTAKAQAVAAIGSFLVPAGKTLFVNSLASPAASDGLIVVPGLGTIAQVPAGEHMTFNPPLVVPATTVLSLNGLFTGTTR